MAVEMEPRKGTAHILNVIITSLFYGLDFRGEKKVNQR